MTTPVPPVLRLTLDGDECVVMLDVHGTRASATPIGVGASCVEAILDARRVLAHALIEVDEVIEGINIARELRSMVRES